MGKQSKALKKIERARMKYMRAQLQAGELQLNSNQEWRMILGGGVEYNGSVEEACGVSALAAAHRVYTNGLAMLPAKIYKKENGIRMEAAHPAERFISLRASPNQSDFDCRKFVASQAFWYGIGFLWVVRDTRGQIEQLLPIPTQCWNESLTRKVAGEYVYTFVINADGKTSTQTLKESQLIIYNFDNCAGKNMGLLKIAQRDIETELEAKEYNKNFYKNGASPGGIVKYHDKLKSEAKDKIRDEFQAKHCGENAFKVAVLDMGLDYAPLSVKQSDAQYIESRKFTVEEISRYTGIPEYMLQSGKQAYSSNEQQGLDYVTNTMQPIITRLEQEYCYKIFTLREIEQGYYIKFNMAALMRADNESRSRFYEKMIGSSVYTPGYCRALEELPKISDDEEKLYMSKNFASLEQVAKGDAMK